MSGRKSYHGNLLSTALVGNGDTATTVLTVVPDSLRNASRAGNGGGKDVVGESASALLPASFLATAHAIPGTLARVQRSLKNGRVGRGGRGSKCQRCKHQSGQRSGRSREEHLV